MSSTRGVFTFYVGWMFFVRFAGMLLFFVILLLMLDLLNESKYIMAVDGADAHSLLRYIRLRSPQIVSQFTPFAALLGIVVTLAGLSHTSEITIMRAAGMSVHRVLFPFGFMCAIIASAHFIFHEMVTVKTSEALDYWVANDYAIDLPEDDGARTGIRVNYDGQFIEAESAARFGPAVLLRNVTIYDFDDAGLMSNVIEARAARHEDGLWRLFGVRYLNAETRETSQTPDALWTNTLDPELLFALTLKPDQTTLGELKIGRAHV